jgi:hypothetical protein
MASFTGPARIVCRGGEIDVAVDLRSRTDSDGAVTWVGHVDHRDLSELFCVAVSVGQYGLILRLPDGREGQFIPSADISGSTGGIDVSGFLRW